MRTLRRLVLPAVVLFGLLAWALGAPWGWRVALGVVVGYGTWTLGVGAFRPLRVRDSSGPAVDVVVDGGVPVYACRECGTQLVLLRRGNDKAPRHCGEPMRFSVVPDEFSGVHDRAGPDFADTVVPDYPPDDLHP